MADFGTKLNSGLAVIFDMDGVIVDSARYHYLAWRTLLEKRNREYSYEEFKTNFGRRTDMQVRRILGNIPDAEVTAFVKEKDILFREIIGRSVAAFPGVVDLIKNIKNHEGKLAVGSSSPTETVHLIVGKLGVKEDFDTIVCGDEVTEGKPSPQIFLTAARKLGVLPEKCVVIEDAVIGVAAAKNGGMRAVAVTNTHERRDFTEADLVVDSLQELKFETLKNILYPVDPSFMSLKEYKLTPAKTVSA